MKVVFCVIVVIVIGYGVLLSLCHFFVCFVF